MPDAVECTRCKECEEVVAMLEGNEVKCITQHPGFNSVCLDFHALQTAYCGYQQEHGHHPDKQIHK